MMGNYQGIWGAIIIGDSHFKEPEELKVAVTNISAEKGFALVPFGVVQKVITIVIGYLSFLRNTAGVTILNPRKGESERRSLSPVTINEHPASRAQARMWLSSGSR